MKPLPQPPPAPDVGIRVGRLVVRLFFGTGALASLVSAPLYAFCALASGMVGLVLGQVGRKGLAGHFSARGTGMAENGKPSFDVQ